MHIYNVNKTEKNCDILLNAISVRAILLLIRYVGNSYTVNYMCT